MRTVEEIKDEIYDAVDNEGSVVSLIRRAMTEAYKMACEDAAGQCQLDPNLSTHYHWGAAKCKAKIEALRNSKTPESFL